MVCSCSSGGSSPGSISSGNIEISDSFSAEATLRTDEYYSSDYLDDISIMSGYTYDSPTSLSEIIAGNDIKIALLDTGIDDHSELDAQLAVSRDMTGLSNEDNSANYNAGIMISERNSSGIHGIAYNSTLIDIKTHDLDDGGNVYSETNWITSGINRAVADDANVINVRNKAINDYDIDSSDYANLETAIYNATKSSVENIIVTEIGDTNDGDRDPLKIAEVAASTDVTNGLMVAVGGVDSGGDITSYSRYCRSVKDFCLTAYTDNITSLDLDDDYITKSTTSSGAAQVSAVFALMLEAFPATSKEDLVTIMLRYATPQFTDDEVAAGSSRSIGSTGDLSEVYGWGILNVEDIFETSAGVVSVSFITPEIKYSISGAAIYIPESLSFISSALSSSLSQVMALDEYNRPFWFNLSDRVNSSDSEVNYFDNFSSEQKTYEKLGVYDNKFNLTFNSNSFYSDDLREGEFNFKGDLNKHFGFSYAQGELAKYNSFFDQESGSYFSDPYLGFSGEEVSNLKLFGNFNKYFQLTTGFMKEGDNIEATQNAISFLGKKYNLSLSYTKMTEDSSIFGMSGSEALAVADTTNTDYYGVTTNAKLNDKLNLLAQYYQGTSNYKGNGGFIENIEAMTRSYSAELQYDLSKVSKLSLTYHVPFYVYGGEANLSTPIALSDDGGVITQKHNVKLNDAAKPLYKFAFEKQLKGDSKASLEIYSNDGFNESGSQAILVNFNKSL